MGQLTLNSRINHIMKVFHIFFVLLIPFMGFGQVTEDYNWQNVPIGGGGYITGMKIHPLDADKRYYRTDVGGAYRWNSLSGRIEQMIHLDNKNLYSVAGIALHPTDTDVLYLSVGRNCDPSQTAILKSTNAGADFSIVQVNGGIPFWLAANGGRACDTNADTNGANNKDKDRQGTPLEINPHNPNELYIGTREKGVYILNLTTLNLTQIPSSSIPYNSDQYSIRSIVFHPTQPRVYVGYPGHGVYVGNLTNGNYTHYGGANNTELQDAIDISISKDADYLLVACRKQGIMKATNLTNTLSWTKLTGLNPADDEGYLTADCSPHDNDVAITVVADWNHINEFQVTTNAGGNWNQVGGSVSAAANIFPWRNNAFASHVSQIAFDPVNASQVHYTSWFSTFATDNFTTTGSNDWHNSYAKGHEEIVPTDLVAMPINVEGNFLMAGSGDHSGFLFDSGISNPDNFATFHITDRATGPVAPLKKCASLDFCDKQSDNLVVCVTAEWEASEAGILTSNDGGLTWNLKAGYDMNANQKAIVAMSSDNPLNIVALNSDNIEYTIDGGENFLNAVGTNAGVPPSSCTIPYSIVCKGATDVNSGSVNSNVFGAFRNITADKNYACVFYYYDWNGDFSISTDGGETWCIVNDNTLPASNDPWEKTRLISIPNHAGHLWININKQLWHSTDAGANWSNYSSLHSVDKARALTFGKGFNASYEALYIYGSIDGVPGDFFYRSDDKGITWVKINDHAEKESWGDNKIIAGDRNVAGRLYATASGQGVVYGDAATTQACDNVEKTSRGEFDDINSPNIPDWVVSEINGATMTGTINQWTKAVLDIMSPGTNNFDLQLWQDDLTMDAGKLYLIQLDLRADSDRPATVKLRNKSNGTTYLEKDVDISSTAQQFSFLFKPSVSDNDLRLTLMVGGHSQKVYVDHIRFREFCETDISSIDCDQYIRLENHDIDEQNYHADIQISSNGRVLSNDNISFEAGDNILLEPGFEVQLGATFIAEIVGCP